MHDGRNDRLADLQLFLAGLAQMEDAGGTVTKIDRGFVTTDRRDDAFHRLAGAEWTEGLRCLRGEQLLHRLGIDGHAGEPRIGRATPTIPQTGTRRGTVNPTARWPERLEHLATLLRADALAVVSATSDKPSAIFSYRLTEPIDWLSALGSDVFASVTSFLA